MPGDDTRELRAELAAAVRAHQQSADAVDEAAAAALGVNRTDLRCLDILMSADELTPGALSTRLGLTTGSVTAMIDRLERQGYVTRAPSPTDRRKVVIRPTEAARSKATALYDPIASEGDEILTRYTPAELATITDFLNRAGALQEAHAARIRGA